MQTPDKGFRPVRHKPALGRFQPVSSRPFADLRKALCMDSLRLLPIVQRASNASISIQPFTSQGMTEAILRFVARPNQQDKASRGH